MSSKWTIRNDFLDNLKNTKEKNEKLQRELHKIGVFKDICFGIYALLLARKGPRWTTIQSL